MAYERLLEAGGAEILFDLFRFCGVGVRPEGARDWGLIWPRVVYRASSLGKRFR